MSNEKEMKIAIGIVAMTISLINVVPTTIFRAWVCSFVWNHFAGSLVNINTKMMVAPVLLGSWISYHAIDVESKKRDTTSNLVLYAVGKSIWPYFCGGVILFTAMIIDKII